MGLDIGFDIYKKEKDKTGKITLIEKEFPENREDDAWCCGRCDVNYSWGYGHSYGEFGNADSPITKPTFDKELDGYKFEPEKEMYSTVVLKYIPFKEFKDNVTDAIEETEKQAFESKHNLFKQVTEKTKTISELRNLQKECDEDNEFAFNKWTEEIKDLKDEILELNEMIDNYDSEDYDASHAKRVKNMLKYLEECQKDGYVCIPFFSD